MDMDKLYGVGITNRYSCFIDNEDADPAEVKDGEKDLKKKGKGNNTGTTAAEKENRGKEITTSSSTTSGKELSSTKVQKQKPANEKTVTSPGPRVDRKGIRDSNTKGNEIRGSNRASVGQQKEQRSGEGGDKRPPRSDRPRPDGDRAAPRDRPQGDRFQGGERPQGGDRYQGDRNQQQGDRYQGQGDRFQGGDRPARFNNDDGREVRNNRRNEETNRESSDFDGRGPRRDGGYFRGGDRGRGQNFRGSRGGGMGTGGGPGGFRKREFDRQSGSDKSGVKAVDKRDGAGSRNWGTYKDDEVEVTAEGTVDENVEERIEEQAPPAETTFESEEAAADAEQQKLMTLDEWKAMQEPRAKPVFNLRKAGEGEDQSQWKKMTLKKKEKEDDEEEEEEDESEELHQRAGRQKQILDVNFTFADSRRGGFGQRTRPGGRGAGSGDRGGRGERTERGGGNFYRGGEGRGEGRGGFRGGFSRGGRGGGFSRENERNPRQAAPKVDDDFDFPALG